MKKIAVTGIIASGKSVVCNVIEKLGGEVIYTDKINSELLLDKDYILKLAKIFPNAVQNGVVLKEAIRKQIIENDSKRQALNSLAHSEIKQRVEKIVSQFNGKKIFCEIPLIVESNMVDYFDEIWCVVADNNVRINRIVVRDKVSELDAKRILECQKSERQLIKIASEIIENNGDIKKVEERVKELINR